MLILCRSGLHGAQLSHSALFFHSAPLLLRGLARRPYLTVCASFSLARSLSPLCTKSVYSDSRAVQNSFFYQLVTRPVSSALRPVVRLQYSYALSPGLKTNRIEPQALIEISLPRNLFDFQNVRPRQTREARVSSS